MAPAVEVAAALEEMEEGGGRAYNIFFGFAKGKSYKNPLIDIVSDAIQIPVYLEAGMAYPDHVNYLVCVHIGCEF